MSSRIAISVIPTFLISSCLHLLVFGFGAPMGDNLDDITEWMGNNPNHMAAPSLRGIKTAPLQGGTLEVGRDAVTVRVINGGDQRRNTSRKGTILSAQAISPGNLESRKIISNGNRLMLARTKVGHPLIPSYRKIRSVSDGNV